MIRFAVLLVGAARRSSTRAFHHGYVRFDILAHFDVATGALGGLRTYGAVL